MPQAAERQLAVAAALARLLTLAGMERYAEVCASADTARILGAYAISRDDGLARTPRPSAPPTRYRRTPTCSPGPRHGHDERAAYDACAAAIELAVAARELKVGVSGWKTKRAALVERWLTRTTDSPDTDSWLSRISAERIDEWAHGHPGERSQLARRIMPRLLEPPELLGEPLPTLRWLLSRADAGLRLTARHYIAPSLVGEAAGLFGWQPRVNRLPGTGSGPVARGAAAAAAARRHQELEVYPLHILRGLAQHEMGAVRRIGATLVLTKTGRLMADDAAVRWHIGTAALIGPDDGTDPDFTVAVREAALLMITAQDGPVGYEELAWLDRAARDRRLDIPVGQQPHQRDRRRDPRAAAPAAGPAAARRGLGTRIARADRERNRGGAVRTALPCAASPPPRPRVTTTARSGRAGSRCSSRPGKAPRPWMTSRT